VGGLQPAPPNLISLALARPAKATKVPVIRVHNLRHNYASAGIEAVVRLKAMQERLGHGSVGITGDIFSQVNREVNQSEADRIAAVISGRGA
jgi:integrase